MTADLLTHVLRQGDRALVLSHRLAQWITHAPTLEEDVALANISLDLLGQARHLFTYAGEIEGKGHDEAHFASWRDTAECRNPLLVEQPNGDFAVTIARQVFHDQAALLYWESMTESTDATLAALAARARNETAFHLQHSAGWLIRLGDGTDESQRRAQAGVDAMWPFTLELLGADDEGALRADGLIGGSIETAWRAAVAGTLLEAGLRTPTEADQRAGGIHGTHSEHLEPLLEEMQQLARAHPGASW
jgi:ring-1,2-phenylacetyl-CoA epoxidase subunit PaaC